MSMNESALPDLLDRAIDVDPDLRFMALNDLNKFLTTLSSGMTPRNVDKVTNVLFDRLDDSNSDVQNQAVKCFAPLIKSVQSQKTVSILNRLCCLSNNNSITTSITTMALRSSLSNLVVNHSTAKEIIANLLPTVKLANIDAIEILTDLIKYLGVVFSSTEILDNSLYLINLAFDSDGIVSKRAIVALGLLFRYASPEQATSIINSVSFKFDEVVSRASDLGPYSIRLSVFSNLLKNSPSKILSSVPSIAETIRGNLFLDELEGEQDYDKVVKYNEIRDDALVCLDHLIPIGYDAIAPWEDTFLEWIVTFLKYDPFYNEDASDADENDEEDDDEDEVSFSDEDEVFDEDEGSDDTSWRLRKQSAKIIKTIVTSYPILLARVLKLVAEPLIIRVRDRVESVADEAIITLTSLVDASTRDGPYYQLRSLNNVRRRGSDVSMSLDSDPYTIISSIYVEIIDTVVPQLSKVKTLARFKLILLLVTSLSKVKEGFEDKIRELLTAIKNFRKETNFNITIELLEFYSIVFKSNSLKSLDSELQVAVDDITECVNSKINNIISESLSTATHLFEASYEQVGANYLELIETILDKGSSKSYSSDIRKKSISSLSALAYNVVLSEQHFTSILSLFYSCLAYESIAEASVIAIEKLFTDGCKNNSVPAQLNFEVIQRLATFIGSSDSMLQLASLKTLSTVGNSLSQTQEDYSDIVYNIVQHITYTNRSQLTLSLDVIATYIHCSSFNDNLFNCIMNIFSSTTKIDDIDVDALVKIVKNLTDKVDAETLYKSIENSFTTPNSVTIKLLATIAIESSMGDKISASEHDLQLGKNLLFNIQFLGFVSEKKELSLPVDVFFEYFDATDEVTKFAAARAVGNMISRDIQKYLPLLLDQLVNNRSHRNSLLNALKQDLEVKVNSKDIDATTIDELNSNKIWDAIIEIQKDDSLLVEDECNAAGSCLALIALIYPYKILDFITLLNSEPSISSSYTMIVTLKHLVSYSEVTSVNIYLSKVLVPVLSLITISNIQIKQGLISTLVTALHSKPHLVLACLNDILPKVYEELEPRKEFVKTIQMGPFKHKIDEGIEIRKVAHELLYSIASLENSSYGINYEELLNVTIDKGLKDDNEIVALSCVIITGVIKFMPEVLGKPDILKNLTERNNLIINKKLKDSAPKQQIEKHQEALNSIVKSTIKINQVVTSQAESIGISAVESSLWNVYYNGLKSNPDVVFRE